MTIKSTALMLLGFAASIFLFTTAGYAVYAFVTGRLFEPIVWVRTTEEAYFSILTMLGMVGAGFFALKAVKR
jgi:hypothetical protein